MLTPEEYDKFNRITSSYPYDDRALLRSVHRASGTAKGMAKAKADWIIACCLEGQPKIGWRDDAREVIAATQ